MVSFQSLQLVIAAALCLLSSPIQAIRLFERRSNLNVPPVNASGWTVPLHGSETCTQSAKCVDSLKSPRSNTYLQALAIGKGLFNYTCENVPDRSPPAFVAQYTQLYNAAPLIPVLPDEDTFHALIPMVLSYDYDQMDNSTMTCMGTIGTLNGMGVVTLYDIDTFEISPSEAVLAPEDPTKNAMWSHGLGANSTWEVYRVETYGGRPPQSCKGQPKVIEIEYAAEYWFYRLNE